MPNPQAATRTPLSLRAFFAVVVIGATLVVGARRVGPAPALGAFLEPAHGVWSLARSARLARDASVRVPGLSAAVRVLFDERAVPHIYAVTEEDAYRALGYVVARERLFQMWLQTMAAQGRLTEFAGAPALESDREMRRLGFTWAAERKLAALDTASQSAHLTRAYMAGVNAYIDAMPPSELPLEFRLLGVRPTHFSTVDAIHLLNQMDNLLTYITPELWRAAAAAKVGDAAAAALFPEAEPIVEPIQPNGAHAPRFDFGHLVPPGAPDTRANVVASLLRRVAPERTAALGRLAESGTSPIFASNNWAVAPARSASGHALLEGDPHLPLTLPSIWYEAQMVVPGRLDVYGVTIPGFPGIIIGFNRDVAWSLTNVCADVLDVYSETVDDPVHPTSYLIDGRWRPLTNRVETYRGPHGETLGVDTLRLTHRGPMQRDHGRWFSLRWTALEPSNELAAFQSLAHAASVRDAADRFAQSFWAPSLNLMLADRAGSIGERSTGRYPVRPGDGRGDEIRDGSRSASDWEGMLPLARYPQAFDPAQHYLASANQQPIDPRQTSDYWGGGYDPWRALRINQLLRADSSVTVEDMRRFQIDPVSGRSGLFLPYFLAAAQARLRHPTPGLDITAMRQAAALLTQWDGRYTVNDPHPILFELAMSEMIDRTWDELDDSAASAAQHRTVRVATPSTAILLELLADSASAWWDNGGTRDRVEYRDDILAEALVAAYDTARVRYGPPGARWAWGRARPASVLHLLGIPALSDVGIPVQGGPGTLNPSTGDPPDARPGPSWRMVVELGPQVRAWATYPGGQSGNPASGQYDDRIPLWATGELSPLIIAPDSATLRGHSWAALTLTPAGR